MTFINVLMLTWAALMLVAAFVFWRKGQTFGPLMIVVDALLILLSQAMVIYERINPHGG